MDFKKLIKIGKSTASSVSSSENDMPDVKISENVLNARKVHTHLSLAMYVCLIIGIVKPLFLFASSGIILYMFFNKRAKVRMHVSTASYNLQLLKLDKARRYLDKAKKVSDSELVKELENNIIGAEKKLKSRRK